MLSDDRPVQPHVGRSVRATDSPEPVRSGRETLHVAPVCFGSHCSIGLHGLAYGQKTSLSFASSPSLGSQVRIPCQGQGLAVRVVAEMMKNVVSVSPQGTTRGPTADGQDIVVTLTPGRPLLQEFALLEIPRGLVAMLPGGRGVA